MSSSRASSLLQSNIHHSTDTVTSKKLEQARDENNYLSKQLEQYKREYGELILKNCEAQNQLAASTHEVNRLKNELLSASHVAQAAKEESDSKVREINMLKKMNYDLSEESRSVEDMKVKYEGELRELRLKCEKFEKRIAKVEEEKEEIRMKEREENSRVLARNAVLQRNYDSVVTAATGRFLTLEKRLSKLEGIVETLNGDSSNAAPKAVTATCVKGQPESYESDTRPTGPVATEEKSASSKPFDHKSSSSPVIDISCSDDDDDLPLTKGLKRKLPSSDVSCKVEDHGSFSIYRLKEQSPQSINPSKKTMAALKPCQQKSHKWDYEADLLDDLQMDTELCMKGVCALYRQLRLCTLRGTNVAKFLTDGDAKKELKKTLADIQNDPELAEDCQRIAVAYSNQLFDIYKNGKDPLFAHDILFCQRH